MVACRVLSCHSGGTRRAAPGHPERRSGWAGPYIPYWLWMAVPAALTWLCVELPILQKILLTTSLTGSQWMAVLLACMITPTVIEMTKAIQRSRAQSAVSR